MNKLIKKFIALLLAFIILLGLTACGLQEAPAEDTATVQATVLEIEKYGHAVLDLTTADFSAMGYALGDVVCVRFVSCERYNNMLVLGVLYCLFFNFLTESVGFL